MRIFAVMLVMLSSAVAFAFPPPPDFDTSEKATAALATFGAAAVPALQRTLDDKDPQVALCAGQALATIHDPHAVQALVSATKSHRNLTRVVAALGLAHTGDLRALPVLLDGLKDRHLDFNIASMIPYTLGELKTDPSGRVFNTLMAMVQSTKKDGEKDGWGYMFNTWNVKSGAAYSLGLLGDRRALPALYALLDTTARQEGNCGNYAEAIMRFGDIDSWPHILRALREGKVSWDRLEPFFGPFHTAALPGLVALLASTDEDVRVSAIQLLGKCGDAAIPSLTAFLHTSSNTRERCLACFALGEIGIPAIPELSKLLNDSEDQVCSYAVSVLAWQTAKDPRVLPLLTAALATHPNREIRCYIAQVLGDRHEHRALVALLAATRDPDAALQRSALQALGKLGDPQTGDTIAALAQSPDANTRYQAMLALAALKDPRALPLLFAYCFGKDYDLHADELAPAFAGYGAQVVDPLRRAALGSRPEYRAVAITTLGRIGDKRAESELLVALSDTDPHIASLAAEALGAIGDPSTVAPLITYMSDEERDSSNDHRGLQALERLKDPRAIPVLDHLQHYHAQGLEEMSQMPIPWMKP